MLIASVLGLLCFLPLSIPTIVRAILRGNIMKNEVQPLDRHRVSGQCLQKLEQKVAGAPGTVRDVHDTLPLL